MDLRKIGAFTQTYGHSSLLVMASPRAMVSVARSNESQRKTASSAHSKRKSRHQDSSLFFAKLLFKTLHFITLPKKKCDLSALPFKSDSHLAKLFLSLEAFSFIRLSTSKIATKRTSYDENYSYISAFTKEDL